MLGIKYIKFDATTFVIHYSNGRVLKQGKGLSFWYISTNSSIAAIPISSSDLNFIFEESTSDFQRVTIQGQITYKVEEPEKLADLLDFTVNSKGLYLSDDPEKLATRLTNEAQTAITKELENLSLREAIRAAKKIEEQIMEGLEKSKAVAMLGIRPLSVNVLSIQPSPEMARALEAKTREALQQEADEAVYARRKFAVEQERSIKESELSTEIAVEEKKKQIAEKKMETGIAQAENQRKLREMKVGADIAVEQERKKLIDLQTESQRKIADAQIYKVKNLLDQYKDIDWKLLMAMQGKDNPQNQMALAFRELAENAQKIGTLNITPDLLDRIMGGAIAENRK